MSNDLEDVSSEELDRRLQELYAQVRRIDAEVARRRKLYRRAHLIPGCSEGHIPGECCMDTECPVHGIMDIP